MILSIINRSTTVDPRVVLHDYFSTPRSSTGFLLTIAGLAALLVMLWLFLQIDKRRRQPPRTNDPQRLFAELLRATPLEKTQRRMLQRLASETRLAQPSVLLLSPQRFVQSAEQWGKSHAAESELRQIRERLFGE